MLYCDRIEFVYLMFFLFVEFYGIGFWRWFFICCVLWVMEMFFNDLDIKYFSVFCKYIIWLNFYGEFGMLISIVDIVF